MTRTYPLAEIRTKLLHMGISMQEIEKYFPTPQPTIRVLSTGLEYCYDPDTRQFLCRRPEESRWTASEWYADDSDNLQDQYAVLENQAEPLATQLHELNQEMDDLIDLMYLKDHPFNA